MTEDERNLDLMVAELGHENKLMKARNERLEKELERTRDENAKLKSALERIISVSRVALWDGVSQGADQLGSSTRHPIEHND